MWKFLLALLIPFGCQENDETSNCSTAPEKMEMKVNGITMVSSDVLFQNVNFNPSTGRIDINAYFKTETVPSGHNHMNLGIEKAKIGKFNIPGGGFQANVNSAYYVTENFDTFYSFHVDKPVAGVITITQFDLVKKTISGSFEVIVAQDFNVNTQTITSGCFTDLPID